MRVACEAHGAVAQSGERLLCKQEVRGSNPLSSTKLYKIENFHHEVQAKGVGRFTREPSFLGQHPRWRC